MKAVFPTFALAALVLAPVTLPAQDADFGANFAAPAGNLAQVAAKLIADRASVAPGETFTLGLTLDHPEHWHTYWKNPGDAGSVTSVTWKETSGATFGDWRLPAPHLYAVDTIRNFVFEGKTVQLLRVTAPASLKPGDTLKLAGNVDWLECDDSSCNPKNASLSISLPVKAAGEPANAEIFAAAETAIPEAAPAGTATLENTGPAKVVLKIAAGALAGRDAASAKFFPSDSEMPAAFVTVKPVVGEDGAISFTFTEAESVVKAGKLAGVVTFAKGRAVEVSATVQKKTASAPASIGTTTAPAAIGTAAVPATIGKIDPQKDRITCDFGTTAPEETPYGLPAILALAFGGGILLNIMPCVFPVLGLKIYGFVNKAHADRKKVITHALVFAAGIIVSFWILAGVIIAVKSGAGAFLGAPDGKIGWGFLQQIPIFNAVVAGLFLVMGLSMAGLFEFGTGLQNAAGSVEDKGGYSGSFLSGVLATLVATPCTGPLMSPALGAAFAAPAGIAFAIFTAIAVGLALPFVILAASPGLLKKLPRPGAWMESFKQGMAFLLFAAFAYFVYIVLAQSDALPPAFTLPAGLFILLAFVLIAAACWVFGRWCAPHNAPGTRRIGGIIAGLSLVAAVAGIGVQLTQKPEADRVAPVAGATTTHDTHEIVWQPWSPERQAALLAEGKTVYIDFTAKWCATCLFNKRVYHDASVIKAFADGNIVALRADWTNRNSVIADELQKYHRSAIPFNVVLKKDTAAKTLPELLTAGAVLEAVEASK